MLGLGKMNEEAWMNKEINGLKLVVKQLAVCLPVGSQLWSPVVWQWSTGLLQSRKSTRYLFLGGPYVDFVAFAILVYRL